MDADTCIDGNLGAAERSGVLGASKKEALKESFSFEIQKNRAGNKCVNQSSPNSVPENTVENKIIEKEDCSSLGSECVPNKGSVRPAIVAVTKKAQVHNEAKPARCSQEVNKDRKYSVCTDNTETATQSKSAIKSKSNSCDKPECGEKKPKVSFVINEKEKHTSKTEKKSPPKLVVVPQQGIYVNKFFSRGESSSNSTGMNNIAVESKLRNHSCNHNSIPKLKNLMEETPDGAIEEPEPSISANSSERLKISNGQHSLLSNCDESITLHQSTPKDKLSPSPVLNSQAEILSVQVDSNEIDSLCYNSLADTAHLSSGAHNSTICKSNHVRANPSQLVSIDETNQENLVETSDQSEVSTTSMETIDSCDPDSLNIIPENDSFPMENGYGKALDASEYIESNHTSPAMTEVLPNNICQDTYSSGNDSSIVATHVTDSLVSDFGQISSGTLNSSSRSGSFFSRSRKTYAPSTRNRNRASMKSTASISSERSDFTIRSSMREGYESVDECLEEFSAEPVGELSKQGKEFLKSMLSSEESKVSKEENLKKDSDVSDNFELNKKIDLIQKVLSRNEMSVEDFAHGSMRSKYRCLAVLATSLMEESLEHDSSLKKGDNVEAVNVSLINSFQSNNRKTNSDISTSDSERPFPENRRPRERSEKSNVSRIPSPVNKDDKNIKTNGMSNNGRKVQMVYPIQQKQPPSVNLLASPETALNAETRKPKPALRKSLYSSSSDQIPTTSSPSKKHIPVAGERTVVPNKTSQFASNKIPVRESKSLGISNQSKIPSSGPQFGSKVSKLPSTASSGYISFSSESFSSNWKSPGPSSAKPSKLPLTEKIITTIGKKGGKQKKRDSDAIKDVEHNIVISAHTTYREALIM